MKFLNKQEIKYIILSSIFLLIFFLFIIPTFYTPDMPPYLAFLLFNLSIVIFMQFFLKIVITNKKPTLKGAIGVMFLVSAFSIISSPLSVNPSGVVNTSMYMGVASADYNISLIYSSLGISGVALYFFTYPFTAILFIIIAGIFIKNFLNDLDGVR